VCWEKKVRRAAITSQRLTARLSHLILADRDTTAATIGRASKGCQLNAQAGENAVQSGSAYEFALTLARNEDRRSGVSGSGNLLVKAFGTKSTVWEPAVLSPLGGDGTWAYR
jgi:hypothetical protein